MKRALYLFLFCLYLSCSMTKPIKTPETPPGMVLIPSGTFTMGCTDNELGVSQNQELYIGCAGPRQDITLQPFYLDKTETIVGKYRQCVDAGVCAKPNNGRCNWDQYGKNNHPINCVDWIEAKQFCAWAGKRLPSEAEWEYAARGGHLDWSYPWGNDKPDCSRAIMDDDSGGGKGCGRGDTWPVGSHLPNGYGLYDMAGNVWEWTQDCWNKDFNGNPADGSAREKGECLSKVLRGGSWADIWVFLSASYRLYYSPDPVPDKYHPFPQPIKSATIGFRCAKKVY